MTTDGQKRIVIAGGGFGGVRTALELSKKNLPNTKIILISDKHHFEYTPALYRVVAGRSPLEVCIPLNEIFNGKNVEVEIDTISKISLSEKKVEGESGAHYHFDYLVLALGAEPAFFGIPGLEQFSMGFKSINQALILKNHLHALFSEYANELNLPSASTGGGGENKRGLHVDVVGAGPSGVELAGELCFYLKDLAKMHKISEKDIMIDLIEAAPRLLPMMPEKASESAALRLKECGVHIMVNTSVMQSDGTMITFKDGAMASKTLIWTAGVKPSHIYKETVGLTFSKNGKIEVDSFMRAVGTENIFVLGDSASTPHAGTAQTAIYDGRFIAEKISEVIKGKKLTVTYSPLLRPYVIPIGHGWAMLIYKDSVLSGRIIWWLREFIDLRFLNSILPFGKAWRAWRDGQQLSESCPTCEEAMKDNA